MKTNRSICFLMFVIFMIIGQTVAYSQIYVPGNQLQKKYLITLKDGSNIKGSIVSENATEILLTTDNLGTITVKRDQIKSTVSLDSTNIRKGKYWFPNPNYSRYFIGPGIQLKKGDGYYQNIDLFASTASYGITNYFSMGGGVEMFSTFSGHPIFILMPKLGFHVSKSLWLGGGILYLNLSALKIEDISGLGVGYGSATMGNDNNNISLGIGWGYLGSKWSDDPVVTLSGMTRISPRFALVTENWFIEGYTVLTYGVRFIGEKMSFDIGLVNSKDIAQEFALGIPILIGFVFKF